MDGMVDISPALPFEFVIKITNREKLLRALQNSKGSLDVRLDGGETSFAYTFGIVGQSLPDRLNVVTSHSIEATAVDLIIANEIYRRIAIYISDAVEACSSLVTVGGINSTGNKFTVSNNKLGPLPGYLRNTFDLSQSLSAPLPAGISFEVTSIELESPTTVRARISACFVSVQLLAAPAAPAAAATTPLIPTVIQALNLAVGAATLYYTFNIDKIGNREAIKYRMEDYRKGLANNDPSRIQNDLAINGCYQVTPVIDGKFGTNSQIAFETCRKKYRLNVNVTYTDPVFLEKLAAETTTTLSSSPPGQQVFGKSKPTGPKKPTKPPTKSKSKKSSR
jgi:hypothetical protein